LQSVNPNPHQWPLISTGDCLSGFLQVRCNSCCPANGVKAIYKHFHAETFRDSATCKKHSKQANNNQKYSHRQYTEILCLTRKTHAVTNFVLTPPCQHSGSSRYFCIWNNASNLHWRCQWYQLPTGLTYLSFRLVILRPTSLPKVCEKKRLFFRFYCRKCTVLLLKKHILMYTVSQKKTWCRTFCNTVINC